MSKIAVRRSRLFAIAFAAALASPAAADESLRGSGRSADASGLRVQPGAPAPGSSTGGAEASAFASGATGRSALAQPGCTICLVGNASISWTGSTGSFHVDAIANYRGTASGNLDLKAVVSSAAPVFGQTINSFPFTGTLNYGPLAAGNQYAPVNSGSVSILSVPSGTYFLLLLLRENVGGTFYYTDFIQMNSKVSCSGSGCTVIQTGTCTEDAYTMCLLGGRYRVTGRWKNQYAGGAQANLQKAKLTDATGAFWISDANTYEFMLRVNTATDNGRAWMSILTFTDVEFWVSVTDVTNGQTKEYHSDPGNRTLLFDPYFFVYP